ncbi:MAG: hypothetical protein K2L84_06120 [Muribaculaceae bacterium]|nr:hypothetical protein [Muribaculaceae bacterium]
MKNLFKLLVGFVLMPFASIASSVDDAMVEDALRQLDEVLGKRNSYIQGRQSRIDSLRGLLLIRPSANLVMDIAENYIGFNNDSAIRYLQLGIDSYPGLEGMPFRWKQASLLPLSGFFDRAESLFNAIPVDSIPQEFLCSYYDSGRQMYSYMAAFSRDYRQFTQPYEEQSLEFQRKLLSLYPKDTEEYRYNLAEYYFLTNSIPRAKVLLEEVIDREGPGGKWRARASHHLSTLAKMEYDENAYTYYLALSAIADVLSATREVVSLQELGALEYASGDIPRSHNYLSHAMANAVECGAPLRMIETSRTLPIIERAHMQQIHAGRITLYWIMAALGFVVLVLIVILFVLRHEMQKMRRLQSNLRQANLVKEVYISQFLQLCSIYMDKLNRFCKIAARKLAAGQHDELYRMVKSGKFVEEQSKEFYDVFDNAFLHIYPDFVVRVNELLRDDARIELAKGELLNTDLRILAFMRLGIEESARIAQVLNYSLNTIYSYRNRLKSRAKNRDTFEGDVMMIPSVS